MTLIRGNSHTDRYESESSLLVDDLAMRQLQDMMKDCEAMRDGARALEIRSTVNHDGLVMSLVPFLLSLSAHEEDVAVVSRRSNTSAKGYVCVSTERPPPASKGAPAVDSNAVVDLSNESMTSS